MASLCLSLLLLFALGSRTGALNVVVETAEEECFYEFLVKGVDLRGSFLVASGGFMDINCEVKGPGDAVLYSVERQTEGHFDIVAADSGEYSVCFSNKASSMVAKSVSFSIHSGAGLPENDVAKKGASWGSSAMDAAMVDRRRRRRSSLSCAKQLSLSFGNQKHNDENVPESRICLVSGERRTNRFDFVYRCIFCPPNTEHLSPLETSVMDLSESLMNVQEEQKFFKARERAHRDSTLCTPPAPPPRPSTRWCGAPAQGGAGHLSSSLQTFVAAPKLLRGRN